MREYVIMTDSSCDLPSELATNLGLEVVPLTVLLDEKTFRNYLDEREISAADFYAQIKAGKSATTSAVNVDEFTQAMEPFLQAGKDVLYLGFSSGLSATYQASTIAAEDLAAKYPEAKVLAVDTLCASMGQGLIVYLAAQAKQGGKGIEEVRDYVESIRLNLAHYFTVDDLHHLKRGGRISAAAAILGSTLHIKPILHVNDEGRLIPIGKVRGRKQAIKKLAEHLMELGTDLEGQSIFISHGNCLEEAELLASMIRELTPVKEVILSFVGPVIGAHSGPGTIALFFLGKHR